MEKIAVYSGSKNIYDDMVTSAKSIIANSDVDKVFFLVEDDPFPATLPDIIETIDIRDQEYFSPWGANSKTRYTYFAMMRGALAKVFPQYDKVLSLDCDVLAIKDISHIWELPIDDYYFSASREPRRSVGGCLYTNAGVMLQNLKKLRETNKVDEIIDVLNTWRFSWVDQDVMNYLCQGYIYDMHSEYNANEYTTPVNNARILHFAGIKRDIWHKHPKFREYNNMTWDEVFVLRKQNQLYPN